MKTLFTIHGIILNDKNEVFLLQRAQNVSYPGTWNCITGFIKERESAEDAVLRELKEETNLEGEIIKTSEPYFVDNEEIRWVITPSLLKINNLAGLKLDEAESQAFKWLPLSDPSLKNLNNLTLSLRNLGFADF